MRFIYMEFIQSMSSNIWDVLNTSGTDGSECSRRLLGARVLRKTLHVRQCYGRRRRDLVLRLYRWTTSEACLVLGGWIES